MLKFYILETDNEIIDLKFNDQFIDEIPKEIKLLTKLKSLDLSGNNIKKIPSEIKNLTNLVKIDLGNNIIEKL